MFMLSSTLPAASYGLRPRKQGPIIIEGWLIHCTANNCQSVNLRSPSIFLQRPLLSMWVLNPSPWEACKQSICADWNYPWGLLLIRLNSVRDDFWADQNQFHQQRPCAMTRGRISDSQQAHSICRVYVIFLCTPLNIFFK